MIFAEALLAEGQSGFHFGLLDGFEHPAAKVFHIGAHPQPIHQLR